MGIGLEEERGGYVRKENRVFLQDLLSLLGLGAENEGEHSRRSCTDSGLRQGIEFRGMEGR